MASFVRTTALSLLLATEQRVCIPESLFFSKTQCPPLRSGRSKQWERAQSGGQCPQRRIDLGHRLFGFRELNMPRVPSSRFINPSDDQYYGSEGRAWNAEAMPPYLGTDMPYHAAGTSGTNFHQTPTHQQQYYTMPPPQSAPRQHHMPPSQQHRAPTQIDTRPPDYWHSNKHLLCINRGTPAEFPHSVSFRPTTGPCSFGVALLNLELGLHMVEPDARLDQFLPPSITRYPTATLLIDWPGYRQERYMLTLIDSRTRRHVTRANIGAQATQHFKHFVDTRREEDFYEDIDGAKFLGVDGVVYDQVRLSELYTKDGMTFHMQFALNAHYLTIL